MVSSGAFRIVLCCFSLTDLMQVFHQTSRWWEKERERERPWVTLCCWKKQNTVSYSKKEVLWWDTVTRRQDKWMIEFTRWHQGYRQQYRLVSSCLPTSLHLALLCLLLSPVLTSSVLSSHFPLLSPHLLFYLLSHHFVCALSFPLYSFLPSEHFSSPFLPLLCRLSQAAPLSDRRHRLGDESLWFQSSKSQTSWCGSDRDLGVCCSFRNGSIKQIDLSFISSICGCVCVCAVYTWVMCVSGGFYAELWWEHSAAPPWPTHSPGTVRMEGIARWRCMKNLFSEWYWSCLISATDWTTTL